VIHLDTSFVVDVLRESSRPGGGPATSLLASLAEDEFAVSVFVVCELFAGAALAQRGDQERQRVRGFLSNLRIVHPDGEFAEAYGGIFAAARRSGRNSGVMDLLIATAAVRERARLVTRDRKDFIALPGLDLMSY